MIAVPTEFTAQALAALRPPPPALAVEWVPEHCVIPAETETQGAFDLDIFPHVLGVLEAADDPMIREIILPWSARLGKTFTAMCLMAFWAVITRRPQMIGRESEEKINDLIDTGFMPLLKATTPTRRVLLPDHRQSRRFGVKFKNSNIRKVYSGAPGSMAGFPACYGLASEISKWSKRASTEADPVDLFSKRVMGFPHDSKLIFESTPGLLNKCNVTSLANRVGVDRRRRMVPCPHCGRFQLLEFGDGNENTPGLKWDKDPHTGRSTPDLADATAWYRCVNGCRIDDLDRAEMMKNGVWLSENQTIRPLQVKAGKFTGRGGRITGKRPAASKVSFGIPYDSDPAKIAPMSGLHSLIFDGWGQIARLFLDANNSDDRRKALQDFNNSVLGKVYDPQPFRFNPHQLAELLETDDPIGICPDWSVFLTQFIDVGGGSADEFYWCVCAWGANGRGHAVDYGTIYGEADLEAHILKRSWQHTDGGQNLRPSRTLIDSGSGFHTDAIYAFCRRVAGCGASKGMDGFAEYIRVKDLAESKSAQRRKKNKLRHGQNLLYEVNHERSQKWIQRIVNGDVGADRLDRFTIAAEIGMDINGPFLDHLLNEYAGDEIEKHGATVHKWERTGDNEMRDCVRGCRALADLLTGDGKKWNQMQRIITPAPSNPVPEKKRKGRFVRKPKTSTFGRKPFKVGG